MAARARHRGSQLPALHRELLELDLAATEAAVRDAVPGVPRRSGGHSLGGQLATCRLALAPGTTDGLWLVASGSPYWRVFPAPLRFGLPLAYRFLPWLANARGFLPGRALGFGGNEARGLIGDWARTALGGRYAARGLRVDLEARMATLAVPVRAATLLHDWMAPQPSLRFLLSKLPHAHIQARHFDGDAAGTVADHFAWMQAPAAIAAWLAAEPGLPQSAV